MSTSDLSVRCTGHLSAISKSRARVAASRLPLEADFPVDVIDLSFLGFTISAVGGVDLFMPEADQRTLQRNLLAVGVEPYGHRGAGAERRKQQIVRTRTGIRAARLHRLVRKKAMLADRELLLELAVAGFAHEHCAFGNLLGCARICGHVEIALSPGSDVVRHIGCIA